MRKAREFRVIRAERRLIDRRRALLDRRRAQGGHDVERREGSERRVGERRHGYRTSIVLGEAAEEGF